MIEDELKALSKRPQTDVGVVHHFATGLYAKQMHLPAGHMAVSHKHRYDHLSILARGVATVRTDHGDETHYAPACIEIKAGLNHAILAHEDVTWFCIHATEATEADEVDRVLIEEQ